MAETFLVAWRRLDQMPGGGEDRLWLFGVARLVLANHHRSDRRRANLGERLRDQLAQEPASGDPAGPVSDQMLVLAALRRLGDLDREVLTLNVWDDLQPHEIAVVLDLKPTVVRTRLSRARARLRDLLEETCDGDPARGHVPCEPRATLLPTIQES